MNLMGTDERNSEEQILSMWRDSMKSVNCTSAHITYDSFLLLMKGQTKAPDPATELLSTPSRKQILVAVPEVEDAEMSLPELAEKPASEGAFDIGGGLLERKNEDEVSMHSLPNIGASGIYESSNSSLGLSMSSDSPSTRKLIAEIAGETIPEIDSKPAIVTRRRSKSLADEKEGIEGDDLSDSARYSFQGDSRRAVVLPEHDAATSSKLAMNKSAISVNRQLYRAHRQMRTSVLEASRRFEEQQARRARDTLIAQKELEEGKLGIVHAGLVMRHGTKVHVTSEAIREYLETSKAEQQQLLEKANRRGGRGRSSRKKTISDMSAMMNPSLGQDELGEIALKCSQTPDVSKRVTQDFLTTSLKGLEIPSLKKANLPPLRKKERLPCTPTEIAAIEGLAPSVVEVDHSLRKATVPGQFRKTEDPFGADGMYGFTRISAKDVSQISTPTGELAKKETPTPSNH